MFIKLHLHPFFIFLLGFIAGLGLQAQLCWSFTWIFFLIISFAIWYGCKKEFNFCHRWLSLLCAGLALSSGMYEYKNKVYQQAQQQFKLVIENDATVNLIICAIDHHSATPYPYHVQGTIDSPHAPFHGYSLLLYTADIKDLKVGDSIIISTKRFSLPKNNGCRWYYLRHAIIGGTFQEKLSYQRIKRPAFHFERSIAFLRENLWESLRSLMPSLTFSLFASLFGGNKDIPPAHARAIKAAFKNWGISHYLARSGAHLAIFTSLWVFLLRFLACWIALRDLILVVLLILYTLLSWSTLSFLRAFYMLLVGHTLQSIHYYSTSLHILSLVTFFTLLINPFHLFFLDFQLSFGFSYALIWLAHIRHQQQNAATLS